MLTILLDAMFLTMQCLPILNDAMFRQCFDKTLPYDVFEDVLKKPKHRVYDAYWRCFYDDFCSMMEPRSTSAPNATSISVKILI